MTTHAIGFAGCSILLLQRALYERRGPSRLQTRLAMYAELLGRAPPQRRLPRAIDDALHAAWHSLGC